MTEDNLLTNGSTYGKMYKGVTVEGERVLLYYRDGFGKLCSKHLMCCTTTGAVEWRHGPGATCSLGTVEIDSDGHRYIKIPFIEFGTS